MQDPDELIAIDPPAGKEVWRMKTGKTPAGIWMSPQGLLFIGIMGADYVEVIDPAKRVDQADRHWSRRPQRIPWPVTARVLVSNRVDGTITPVDYKTLVAAKPIKAGCGVDCMEVTADGKEVGPPCAGKRASR